jgi:hypothetical protein
MTVYEYVGPFRELFSGLDTAFGTGKGQWVKRPPTAEDYLEHLQGKGPGIGIGPLRPDNTVKFAAIDLDEPDFDAAREMQRYLPGTSFIERSRSGNAHVWVFFSEPIEAWVPMGVLKLATEAVGKDHVEIFPKNHDFQMVKLGNYINLPFHGTSRPILWFDDVAPGRYTLEGFLEAAQASLNAPETWRKKARWLQIVEPKPRNEGNFGEAPNLHICAEHIISEGLGVAEGNRNAVFFMLAKCLSNWSGADHDYALEMMRMVNDDSPEPLPDSEILRILGNAERGRYTSTGCDDPLVLPYAHPDCPIAHPRR